MKLLNKTTFYYWVFSLPLLLLVFLLCFLIIKRELSQGLEQELFNQKKLAEQLIDSFDSPKEMQLSTDGLSFIKKTSNTLPAFKTYFVVHSQLEKENEEEGEGEEEEVAYKTIVSFYQSKGQNYIINFCRPALLEHELFEGLTNAMYLIAAFFIISIFVTVLLISRWLWKPFYKTIKRLNEYNLSQSEQIKFEFSNIEEFDDLNIALNHMTSKLRQDFLNQKEFIENTSHELQMPLAIIKTKIDNLMQLPDTNEERINDLIQIEATVNRLAKLNKTLLLMAKIENHQFAKKTTVVINTIIKCLLNGSSDLIGFKGITVDLIEEEQLTFEIDDALCEVMLGNLIQNAIRHNTYGGTIRIEIKNKTILFYNTGNPLQFSEKELYTRFKKGDQSSESNGLGLSIVYRIAQAYNIALAHSYESGMHCFNLSC